VKDVRFTGPAKQNGIAEKGAKKIFAAPYAISIKSAFPKKFLRNPRRRNNKPPQKTFIEG